MNSGSLAIAEAEAMMTTIIGGSSRLYSCCFRRGRSRPSPSPTTTSTPTRPRPAPRPSWSGLGQLRHQHLPHQRLCRHSADQHHCRHHPGSQSAPNHIDRHHQRRGQHHQRRRQVPTLQQRFRRRSDAEQPDYRQCLRRPRGFRDHPSRRQHQKPGRTDPEPGGGAQCHN